MIFIRLSGISSMEEKEFLRKFESFSLPEDQFNHIGHLWLGWLYVRDYPLGIASEKLNLGIRKFAESLGAKDKFNHTLTTTFACAIKSRFIIGESFEEFQARNQDLVKNAITIIATHYSLELLSSDEARRGLVVPDRQPFPDEYAVAVGLGGESYFK